MTMLTPERLIKALGYTPTILEAVLHDVDQDWAQEATDGPAGWSVFEVVCHLRDFEHIFFDRARQTLAEDEPVLTPRDHEAMVREGDYQHQELCDALTELRETRRAFLRWMESLTPDQWQRRALHPENGPMTILDMALQTTLHDVTHFDQISRALEYAERFEPAEAVGARR
jgi:uncharacterized damage-inducible protein DinB